MPRQASQAARGGVLRARKALDKGPRRASVGEVSLDLLLRLNGIMGYEREYRFHPTRRWRFDFAWPLESQKLAVEIEGGIWIRGAHTRGRHFESDCCKYAEAAILGWRLIRVTTGMVKDGSAVEFIRRALAT